jgi:hypothetical protein
MFEPANRCKLALEQRYEIDAGAARFADSSTERPLGGETIGGRF